MLLLNNSAIEIVKDLIVRAEQKSQKTLFYFRKRFTPHLKLI
jgi:hypothetical protein